MNDLGDYKSAKVCDIIKSQFYVCGVCVCKRGREGGRE